MSKVNIRALRAGTGLMVAASVLFLILALPRVSPAYHVEGIPRHPLNLEARVTWVINGNTFQFLYPGTSADKEVICELSGYRTPYMRGEERELGLRATQKLHSLIYNKLIRIKAEKRNRFGTWVCRAWHEGVSINDEMREFIWKLYGLELF